MCHLRSKCHKGEKLMAICHIYEKMTHLGQPGSAAWGYLMGAPIGWGWVIGWLGQWVGFMRWTCHELDLSWARSVMLSWIWPMHSHVNYQCVWGYLGMRLLAISRTHFCINSLQHPWAYLKIAAMSASNALMGSWMFMWTMCSWELSLFTMIRWCFPMRLLAMFVQWDQIEASCTWADEEFYSHSRKANMGGWDWWHAWFWAVGGLVEIGGNRRLMDLQWVDGLVHTTCIFF